MKLPEQLSSLLITITFPFVLIMLAVRILFTPMFLQVEYNRPGFPPDPYGFTTEERLKWGTLSIQYMFNNEGPSFLADLKPENGEPIYNGREVSHMLDVKILLQQALRIFYVFVLLYLLILIWAYRKQEPYIFWNAASRGGWFTVGLIGFILAAVLVSFDALFTMFHRIFFTGDTWLFNYSDTLIRLFPIQLWQDAFLIMGIIVLGLAVFFGIYGNKKRAGAPSSTKH